MIKPLMLVAWMALMPASDDAEGPIVAQLPLNAAQAIQCRNEGGCFPISRTRIDAILNEARAGCMRKST